MMNRQYYAEMYAKALRNATVETGLNWPGDTILVVQSWGELAGLDSLLGMKIFIADIRSSYDCLPAFTSDQEKYAPLLKAFTESMEAVGDVGD